MSDELPSVPIAPDLGSTDAMASWRALLYQRLANQPSPVVMVSDSVRTATSLWTGLRAWVSTFRAVGIAAGDCVVSALPAGDALLQLTLGCLWESVGLVTGAQVTEGAQGAAIVEALLDRHQARGLVHATIGGRHVLHPAPGGWPVPVSETWRARDVRGRVDGTSGLMTTVGGTTWQYAHLLGVAQEALGRGTLAQARVLSLCPWHDRRGLWGSVMLPLLEADELFLPPADVDAATVQRLLTNEPITHVVVDEYTPMELRALVQQHAIPVTTLRQDPG